MKKVLPIVFFLWMTVIPATLFSQGKNPLKLGLRIAPNIGWMSPGTKGYSSDGARLGGTFGFVSEFYFAENYALSTGVNFQFINGKLNFSDSLLNSANKYVFEEINRKYNFVYLEIPVMIKMKTKKFGKMSYFGQIGFGTGFRLKSSIKDNLTPATEDMGSPENYNDYTTLIRESIIVGLGCEIHIDESSSILLGVSYSNSLNNVLTGENYKSQLKEKSQLNFAELNIGFLF
jgi:hypothetical protein